MRTFLLFFAIQFCVISAGDCQTSKWYKTTEEIKREYAACYDHDMMSCVEAMKLYSCIGLIDSVIAMGDRAYGYQLNYPMDTDTTMPDYELVQANEYILQQAGNYRVVMLNESHNYAVNRVFTASLLEGLRKQGFNYLGCEGIGMRGMEVLKTNGYPTTNICCYLQEPQFSNMVRQAISLGYTVFAYDHVTGNSSDERERGQANNIYEIIKRDSSAKIIIHGGHGHISEESDYTRMGYYFKTFSQIDPFTIDQSMMIEHRRIESEPTLYQRVAPRLEFPTVLKDGATIHVEFAWGMDAQVYLPPTKYINRRADWLYSSYLISHPVELSNTTFPVLIKVYVKSEYKKTPEIAVPVDAIELFEEQKTVDVFVPFKGDYLVQVNQMKPYKITVK